MGDPLPKAQQKIRKALAEQIAKARDRTKPSVSLRSAAERAGMPTMTLSHVERGDALLTIGRATALATVYGTTVEAALPLLRKPPTANDAQAARDALTEIPLEFVALLAHSVGLTPVVLLRRAGVGEQASA